MDEAESLCTLTRRIKEKRPCGTYTVNCLWSTGARIGAEAEQDVSSTRLNLIRRRQMGAHRDRDGEHTKGVGCTKDMHRFAHLVGAAWGAVGTGWERRPIFPPCPHTSGLTKSTTRRCAVCSPGVFLPGRNSDSD